MSPRYRLHRGSDAFLIAWSSDIDRLLRIASLTIVREIHGSRLIYDTQTQETVWTAGAPSDASHEVVQS